MAHVNVLDGNATVLRNAAPNSRAWTVWIRFDVLADDLFQEFEGFSQWWLFISVGDGRLDPFPDPCDVGK
jgi:hypothetical protein